MTAPIRLDDRRNSHAAYRLSPHVVRLHSSFRPRATWGETVLIAVAFGLCGACVIVLAWWLSGPLDSAMRALWSGW